MLTSTYRPNSDGSTAWDVETFLDPWPPNFTFDDETELNTTQKNTVSTDDSNVVYSSQEDSGAKGFKIRINIDENPVLVTQLNIQMKIDWNGPAADGNSQNVHIWNNDSETWIEFGQLTGTENPSIQTSNNEITENVGNYIDESGNVYYFFVSNNVSVKQNVGLAYTQTVVTHVEGTPQMNIKGNNQNIPSGSDTPSLSDHTDFGEKIKL